MTEATSHKPDASSQNRVPFNIVLVEPEIPGNTGNVGRLCAATSSKLHLVHPLGFEISDKQLKRAGMDYWYQMQLQEWKHWQAFEKDHFQPNRERCFLLTTKSKKAYTEISFQPGDTFIFGRETKGLPESLLHAHPDQALTIPMLNPLARSLNLATSVGIVLYEALRQAGRLPQGESVGL